MSSTHRRVGVAVAAAAVLAVSVSGLPTNAATGSSAGRGGDQSAATLDSAQHRDEFGYYDARELTAKAAAVSQRSQLKSLSPNSSSYLDSLGPDASVSFDPLTQTPRNIMRSDGYLTKASSGSARSIALGYVRAHLAAFGLSSADLETLTLRRDYVDSIGIHHLSWTQSADGVEVFGNGLRVNVTKNGRVLSVQGSPVHDLAGLASRAPSTSDVSAGEARHAAADDVQGTVDSSASVASKSAHKTTWSNNDVAKKVWFLTASGLRPGWSTYVVSGPQLAYQHVVDAVSGKVLFRRSTIDNERGDAYAYDNYPGSPKGGKARTVNLIKRGWLSKSASYLNGKYAITWADVNDDNQIQASEKTAVPGNNKGATFPLVKFGKAASPLCKSWVCTWNPNVANSWKTNKNAEGAQAFYFASNFHDYLKSSPIKFTPQAGNFEAAGGDPVLLNVLDGANTAGGFPDGNHIDNANMSTPPDGIPPTMQMYLFVPDETDPFSNFVPTTGSFDASVLYHEYTHGLSNRLVVDAGGNSTLNSIQAGSMGEAWSDYYAMDYLVTKGFLTDTSAPGQLLEGKYVSAGEPLIRTMPMDCPVQTNAKACTNSFGTRGGYTYGDFPDVVGVPEVHGSGEIWGQTLWDIRTALGHTVADTLITRAMSLSADDPSFLDMRDAIMQADLVAYGASHQAKLWSIFAARGMGWYAGTANGGNDPTPGQDFHSRPAPQTPRTTITGKVTDSVTGNPVAGAIVTLRDQDPRYTAVTNAAGTYSINEVYVGTYQRVAAVSPGYLIVGQQVSTSDPDSANFVVDRDWAAASGGASIADFTGPDFSPQCGPQGAIDVSQGTGWGSTTGDDFGTPTNVMEPKYIVVDMGQAIDLTKFAVDPTATCGDGGSASTGDYRIETSPDGSTWTTAAEGTFTVDDRGTLVDITPTAGADGVRYLKFWMLGNQTPDFATNCPDGAYSGCSFTDMSEIEAFGSPTP